MDISLNEEHELQVQSYLRFAKLKRDQHVRETLMVIREFKDDKLHPGEMYSYKDLAELFKEMEGEVHSLVDKEIQHAYHTNALLVKMLLHQAQSTGLELHVDTNQLENEFLLKTIANSESIALDRPASDFVRRNGQLSKLGTVATVPVQDARTMKEKQQLEEEVKSLQERLQKLQEQTTASMREKSALVDQVNKLRDELADKDALLSGAQSGKAAMLKQLQEDFKELSTQAAGAASTSQEQFAQLQRQLQQHRDELQETRINLADTQQKLSMREKEISELKGSLDSKVQDAPQFRQMRNMMQAKNTEVVDLRKRLAVYEPQTIPSADNY